MVLFMALAWSGPLDVDAVEPWVVGDARLSPSATAAVSVDSNPRGFTGESRTAVVRSIEPGMDVVLDTPDTSVKAGVSAGFSDVLGDAAWPLDQWMDADADADVEVFRTRRVGLRAAYSGRLRGDGAVRDVLSQVAALSNDVELAVPFRTSRRTSLELAGQLVSANHRYWTPDGVIRPYNYSDAVSARVSGQVVVSQVLTVGARLVGQRHRWGASSLAPIGSAEVSVPDVDRAMGHATVQASAGVLSVDAALGWDGTALNRSTDLDLADRLVGDCVVSVQTDVTSVEFTFERFNDRPLVADLSVVYAAEVATETQLGRSARLGTAGGVRTDELLAEDAWQTTRLYGAVHGAVDLSPNLTTTASMTGSWRDHDAFDRLPIARVVGTVALTGRI